jgi:glycerophosphoryl diester phosphodiesterase
VWTVNDATEARDLAALGVAGIITDAPAEIRAALGA